ncbi:MAG: hypothetical protein HQK54_18185 [Oligoflexales bacterium]|nr:hypothetical protein [Oligoflexales bacterium]
MTKPTKPIANIANKLVLTAVLCLNTELYPWFHEKPSFKSPVSKIASNVNDKCETPTASYGQWFKFKHGWVYSRLLEKCPRKDPLFMPTFPFDLSVAWFEQKAGIWGGKNAENKASTASDRPSTSVREKPDEITGYLNSVMSLVITENDLKAFLKDKGFQNVTR